jgi:aminoglycoside/choline kinase family phosphotransferase
MTLLHHIHPLHPLPQTPEDLTPPWMTAALRAGELDIELSSLSVRSFGEGAGMMSRLVRVELEYAAGHGPDSVVVKMPTQNAANRQTAIKFHNYRREVLFYRDLAHQTAARMPIVYYADIIGDDQFVLVMEDLGDYRIGDQVIGATADEARLAMTAMAELHAPFWDRVDGPEFEFIPPHYRSYHADALHQGAIAVWDTMVVVAGDALPPEMAALKDRFLAALPRLQEWITASPGTIVQGDFRMDNLFFGDPPDQAPIAICDWQAPLRCKGVHDLAYFLSQSLHTDVRREHERELVALWHAGLVEAGVTGYSAEQAWEDYRRGVLVLWTYVTVIAGILDPSNERGKAWILEMIRRASATILDLEIIDLLPEFE